jgi:hypothetical protein|tara:strand:+ start:3558 stop:3821 length:264 start_codon:yes stop_codon:yes gene_type:complete
MAITKTTTLRQVAYDATQEENAGGITAFFMSTIDDPDDSELPVTTYNEIVYPRYTISEDADGNVTSTDTDMTSANAVVQAIATAVWV